uniref:Putative secreted protein n=1 Tax=Anopheles marajoara TaxID=58244 RepID=A0A2M4CCL1_9DIPT
MRVCVCVCVCMFGLIDNVKSSFHYFTRSICGLLTREQSNQSVDRHKPCFQMIYVPIEKQIVICIQNVKMKTNKRPLNA